MELRREEETTSSADEQVEALGKAKEADQSVEYITHFVKVIELYQKENKNCLGVGAQTISYETTQRMLAHPLGKCI